MADYLATRDRVETYFDRTATTVWERLTSDAPVSGIRATVRAGRDRMREVMLSQLPADMTGMRVLDAGAGTGAASVAMAARGARVVAVDISPQLIEIGRERCPEDVADRIEWVAGDMLDPELGAFDHAFAMDSMIYYSADDIAGLLGRAARRVSGRFVFTLPPRTPLLMTMYRAGKLFPRKDRSPQMVPQAYPRLRAALDRAAVRGTLTEAERVTSGFYISTAYVFEGAA